MTLVRAAFLVTASTFERRFAPILKKGGPSMLPEIASKIQKPDNKPTPIGLHSGKRFSIATSSWHKIACTLAQMGRQRHQLRAQDRHISANVLQPWFGE
jgi:hypothetical protein